MTVNQQEQFLHTIMLYVMKHLMMMPQSSVRSWERHLPKENFRGNVLHERTFLFCIALNHILHKIAVFHETKVTIQ